MRKYYVEYYKDFSNTYNLFYANNDTERDLLPEGVIRISRKMAEKLCAEEKGRRKTDQSFSGFADTAVFPIEGVRKEVDFYNDKRYEKRGNVWERK